jgi:hypothetical protein
MAISKTSSKKTALKLVAKRPRTKAGKPAGREAIIRQFLDGICAELIDSAQMRSHLMPDVENNPFAYSASQLNSDLALAALCESEGDISIEVDEYWDFFWSSEYQKLQRTFRKDVEARDENALVNLAWRAYSAGRLSPERLVPDSADSRAERHRRQG